VQVPSSQKSLGQGLSKDSRLWKARPNRLVMRSEAEHDACLEPSKPLHAVAGSIQQVVVGDALVLQFEPTTTRGDIVKVP